MKKLFGVLLMIILFSIPLPIVYSDGGKVIDTPPDKAIDKKADEKINTESLQNLTGKYSILIVPGNDIDNGIFIEPHINGDGMIINISEDKSPSNKKAADGSTKDGFEKR